MVDVPTKDEALSQGKTGAVGGIASGLGQQVGRGILGLGVGTALGGILASTLLSGTSADTVAILSVDKGIEELLVGGGGAGTSEVM